LAILDKWNSLCTSILWRTSIGIQGAVERKMTKHGHNSIQGGRASIAISIRPFLLAALLLSTPSFGAISFTVFRAKSAFAAPIALPSKPSERPQLKSIYAQVHGINEFFSKNAPGGASEIVVCVFVGRECPVAQQYLPTLAEIHEQYGKHKVRLLAIYANPSDDLMDMAQHAHDADIPFAALLDVDQRLADLLDVQRTPEVVVLDKTLEIRYQGAIDNQFTKRGKIQSPTKNYLRDALDSVLAGKPVDPNYVHANGCPLERGERTMPVRGLTYYGDVAAIVQRRCQACHREGEIAPFALATYDEVSGSAERIGEVIAEKRMPPWHGFLNPKFGQLMNDQRLTEDEQEILEGWIAQGCPEGDPQTAPPEIQWPKPGQWKIGTPDFVYKMPQPFLVPKTGIVDYQFFRVPLNFTEDRWFQAVEVAPGNVTVVHHIGVHIVPASDKKYEGFSGMTSLYGAAGENGRLINDYVPGDTYNAKIYPLHQAVRIPKGSDLIYELHYTPNNREAAADQSLVAFRWAPKPPQEEILTEVFRKPMGRFRIPPGDPHFKMVDTYYFPHDVWIDAVRPHFHLRAKSFRLEIVERDASDAVIDRQTLLTVPVWDQDWQRTYELQNPLWLAAGAELVATAVFDNSAMNPNNPDPTVVVNWGQQTTDEMFSVRFKYRLAKPGSNSPDQSPGSQGPASEVAKSDRGDSAQ
jgi:thiol-disulfide isomerase/thioredoxin